MPWGTIRKLLLHGASGPPETLGPPRLGPVADQKGSVLEARSAHYKTVRGSLWGDAWQRKDSDAAVESFWRWTFDEIWLLWRSVGVPRGSRGVPGSSPGGPRGVPQGPWGVPRGSQGRACGVPGGPRVLPGLTGGSLEPFS